MNQRNSSVPLLLLVSALGSCADDAQSRTSETEGGAEGDTGAHERVSYYEHVRPVLAEHCVSCHQEGAIAPFPLDTYDAVKGLGPLVRAAVESRTMPPFGVNNDGSCNTFQDARWLSEEDIELIGHWIDDGYQAGNDTLAVPEPPPLPRLEGDDIRAVGVDDYQPVAQQEIGSETEDYQCFLLPLENDRDRYLVGFEVEPGNKATVHHVLGMRVNLAYLANGATIEQLDALSPDQPGWDCFGAAGEGVFPQGVPVTWAPGMGAIEFPGGAGIKFAADEVMVMQVHYNLSEDNGKDSTKIKLKWSNEVEREAFNVLWDPFLFSAVQGTPAQLPAGDSAATFEWNDSFREMLSFDGITQFEDIELLGVIPHMHKRGTRMSIELETGGENHCAADVDRWDFDWQRMYFFDQSMPASLDDHMRVVCQWDTSDDTEPVLPGFGTRDEMCLVGLFFAGR